jgi:large subunit ribosomal protein L16
MAGKKKNLQISPKISFKKPSKSLSNLVYGALSFKNTRLLFGNFGIQADKAGFMERGQIEAARIMLKRPIKKLKNAKVWVLIKPNRIVTKRANETRMGKGKGSPFKQVALISKGQIVFEFIGPTLIFARKIFKNAKNKFAFPVSLIASKNGAFEK